MENTRMERQSRQQHPFVKCVARRAFQNIQEITLRPTIWKEYLFRVIVVTRPSPQDQVWAFTKLNPVLRQGIININKQYKQYPKF